MPMNKHLALFLIVVMFGSGIGYAVIYQGVFSGRQQQEPNDPFIQQQQELNNIMTAGYVNRELTSEEKALILETGRTLVENFYPEGCAACAAAKPAITTFAGRVAGFVVVEEAVKNESLGINFIAPTGYQETIPFANATEANLMDKFCGISTVQPAECLLRDIGG
ncbi:MAG: hypothetical protein HY519_01910 [Candidatus Aenigmarchaeota archaeon]|nr:hypothetical protein [Candidatus Aenigmarchaeota archaeon]